MILDQGVAQSGSVSVLGTEGHVFKSRHPDFLCMVSFLRHTMAMIDSNLGVAHVRYTRLPRRNGIVPYVLGRA